MRIALNCLIAALILCCGMSFAEETAEAAAPEAATTEVVSGTSTIAYYFHNTVRCKSCLAIENMSHEVIENDFADEIASGRLVWQMKNLDEEENEHFIDDYKLYTKSLVLVEFQNGEQTRWTNCTKVWELLNNEKKFKKYVHDEVAEFLGKE